MNQHSILRIVLWTLSLVAAFAGGHFSTRVINAEESPSPAETNLRSASKTSLSSEKIHTNLPSIPKYASSTQMIAAIVAHDIPSSRMRALLALLDSLDSADFPEVISGFERSGLIDVRRDEYKLLFATWAEVAPEEAMAYAERLFDGTLAKESILESWATHDPEAAIEWAEANYASPNADLANPWLVGVIQGIAPQNISLALSLVEGMPSDSEGRTKALGIVLSHWHGKNPDQAFNWLQTIEDDFFRSEAVNFLAKSISASDPEGAFERLLELNNGSSLEVVGQEIAHHRYLENPEETKEWVATLPEIAIGEAAHAVVNQSTKQDPIATAQWMANLLESNPDGYYQGAIKSLIEESTLIEPQVSAEWITALHSQTERSRLYQEVLSEWLEKDQSAAQDWVQYNYQDMPEHVIARFFPDFVPEIDPHNRDESALIEPNLSAAP